MEYVDDPEGVKLL